MKRSHDGGKRLRSLSVRVLLIAACAAQPAAAEGARAIPSVAPGTYRANQSISFSAPPRSRLLVGLDGARPSESALPLTLSVPYGEERTFVAEAVIVPYDPEGAPTVSARFSWTIDRKDPDAPTCAVRAAEVGRWATLGANDGEDISWMMHHPLSGASASGGGKSPETVYVPDGTTLCAWVTDRAGNRGRAIYLEASEARESAFPCRIVSPVPGAWANPQALVIDAAPGVEISFTTDGSDPSVNGVPYREPVILSDAAIKTVRVYASDGAGGESSSSVTYSVNAKNALPAGTSPVRDLSPDVPFVEVGDFLEVHASPGFACAPGDSVPSDTATDRLVLSAVRGIKTYLPMTVTDGVSAWRWVFGIGDDGRPSGPVPAANRASTVSLVSTSVADSPEVRVMDWYFADVRWKDPVYASLDGLSWAPCAAPVFVDRSADHALFWYSDSWKNGEVQRLSLPAKPVLAGLPARELTADPVFVSCEGSAYDIRYEGGYFAPAVPDASSPSLASGLLAEIPNGAETRFSLRFSFSVDGIEHGALSAYFAMDRKAPRSPTAGIPDSLAYSRDPVVIVPAGEDMIQVSVEGGSFTRDDGSFTLEGDPSRAIEYTVRLFAVDLAGNRSPVRERKLTVDRNALYVNRSASGAGTRDGSPTSPFETLDDALSAIRGTDPWRIELAGDASLGASRAIRNDVTIRGNGHAITVAPDASLSVIRSSLSLADATLSFLRAERGSSSDVGVGPTQVGSLSYPRASPLQLDGATLSLDRCSVAAVLSSSGSLVRARDSLITMRSTVASVSSSEYAILVDAERTPVTIESCALSVSAKDAVCLSLSSASATVTDSALTISPTAAGRAVEAWSSSLFFSRVNLARAAGGTASEAKNSDAAVWLDGLSHAVGEGSIAVTGFARARDGERAK